jgi:hypothetical protein
MFEIGREYLARCGILVKVSFVGETHRELFERKEYP